MYNGISIKPSGEDHMSLSSRKILNGIAMFVAATRCDFYALAKNRHIEEVEESRKKSIAGLKQKEGLTDDEAAERVRFNYELTMDQTSAQAEADVNVGIETRLRGALATFEADKELETIRLLLLALGKMCWIIGWKEAVKYLGEQDRLLFERQKQGQREAA